MCTTNKLADRSVCKGILCHQFVSLLFTCYLPVLWTIICDNLFCVPDYTEKNLLWKIFLHFYVSTHCLAHSWSIKNKNKGDFFIISVSGY